MKSFNGIAGNRGTNTSPQRERQTDGLHRMPSMFPTASPAFPANTTRQPLPLSLSLSPPPPEGLRNPPLAAALVCTHVCAVTE